MSETLRLFDPSPYGGELTPKEARATRLRPEPSSAVETHVEPWCQIRHRSGLHPYFHLVSAQGLVGNVVALCGAQGTKVHNDQVTTMLRCPTCAVAQDILRP